MKTRRNAMTKTHSRKLSRLIDGKCKSLHNIQIVLLVSYCCNNKSVTEIFNFVGRILQANMLAIHVRLVIDGQKVDVISATASRKWNYS